MRIVWRSAGKLHWRLSAATWRAWMRAAGTYHAGPDAYGLRLGAIADAPPGPEIYAKVAAALDLLAEYDPRRIRRLQRDLDAVVLTDLLDGTRAAGVYMPGSRTCYLGAERVAARGPADLAVLIAHEATHARLDRLRLGKWPGVTYRVEHRCLREELAFAGRLPEDRFPGVGAWCARHVRESAYREAPARRGARRASGAA